MGVSSHSFILDVSSLNTLKPTSRGGLSPSRETCPPSAERIFFPERRMRSLPISQIFLYPALYASLFSLHTSGSCTMIKRRLPPSSALSCMTAWAVVALPLKKSRIMSSLSLDVTICSIRTNNDGGLGYGNILPPNISMLSKVAFCVLPTSEWFHTERGITAPTSLKNAFFLG